MQIWLTFFSVEDIFEKLSVWIVDLIPQNLKLFIQSISRSWKAIIISYGQEHVT